ncbi:hypothetical protein BGY98DRAFT_1175294 [Russula aff. rugulosa BPL654]|nr:hypothetical protein BGY98DRAFT_1175294 [Russula aff. rugulosa BPL654]
MIREPEPRGPGSTVNFNHVWGWLALDVLFHSGARGALYSRRNGFPVCGGNQSNRAFDMFIIEHRTSKIKPSKALAGKAGGLFVARFKTKRLSHHLITLHYTHVKGLHPPVVAHWRCYHGSALNRSSNLNFSEPKHTVQESSEAPSAEWSWDSPEVGDGMSDAETDASVAFVAILPSTVWFCVTQPDANEDRVDVGSLGEGERAGRAVASDLDAQEPGGNTVVDVNGEENAWVRCTSTKPETREGAGPQTSEWTLLQKPEQ